MKANPGEYELVLIHNDNRGGFAILRNRKLGSPFKPFCGYCLFTSVDRQAVALVTTDGESYHCPACSNTFLAYK